MKTKTKPTINPSSPAIASFHLATALCRTTPPRSGLISCSLLRRGFSFFLLALALGCGPLLPVVRAVTPAPDGGYAGQNTAEGTDALFSLTTWRGKHGQRFWGALSQHHWRR